MTRLSACCPRRQGRGGGLVEIASGLVLVGAPLLIRRMRQDLARSGRLRARTAAWTWSTYGAHAVLTTSALRSRPARPPLPQPLPAAAAGLTAAGGTLAVAGARCFAGPGQLTGTTVGPLVTGGVYRYSRNPQYAGLLAAWAGLTIIRRSAGALALTAGLAAAYRAWVPIEERHLAVHFGEPYRRYRQRTARWLGPPVSRSRRLGDRHAQEDA